MKIKQIKFLIIPALVATLGTASVFTALTTSCGKDTNTTTISFDSHPDNLEYGHDMIISAHSANGTPVSLSAAGTGKDTKWTFDASTGLLSYTSGEFLLHTVVTITATSKYAGKRMTDVTLLPHNTIVFNQHADNLNCNSTTTISPYSTSGAVVTTVASGSGRDEIWTYDPLTGLLSYIKETFSPIIITFTASSILADSVTINVTLNQHSTISLNATETELYLYQESVITASSTAGHAVSLSASGEGEGNAWNFEPSTGVFQYIGSTLSTVVTITASSLDADQATINITLLSSNIISLTSTKPVIKPGEQSIVAASCTSGAPITLVASGDMGPDWTFDPATGIVDYIGQVFGPTVVIITASSPYADDKTIQITLDPGGYIPPGDQ